MNEVWPLDELQVIQAAPELQIAVRANRRDPAPLDTDLGRVR